MLFSFTFRDNSIPSHARCNVVVKPLCYKPESRGFETRRGELIFSIYLILPAALVPGVYSASNRNEYQKQTKIFLVSKARPVRSANNFAAMRENTAWTMGDP
jgi:hypothetical protein